MPASLSRSQINAQERLERISEYEFSGFPLLLDSISSEPSQTASHPRGAEGHSVYTVCQPCYGGNEMEATSDVPLFSPSFRFSISVMLTDSVNSFSSSKRLRTLCSHAAIMPSLRHKMKQIPSFPVEPFILLHKKNTAVLTKFRYSSTKSDNLLPDNCQIQHS